jgi:protoporphyrin/coproporphyrin ferrochelatase
MNYDAVLIVSFGGPEGMDDVLPFLENVLRGRNVPRERLLQVAKHYELFGGVSPINEQNRTLIAALKLELETNGPALPIYWGNRNWHPLLVDSVRQMADDGVRNALAFVTSAYSSYSSCRQYLEDIAQACESVGDAAPVVDKIRGFYNHPLFIEANSAHLRDALNQIPSERKAKARIAFTAHSIPQTMADGCAYQKQLLEAGRLIAAAAPDNKWQLVYQSRSGPTTQQWLEPDIGDHLQELKLEGVEDVVVAPIGFVSDHMEVIYDLDTKAKLLSEQLGLNMVRARTAGTHPAFVRMIRELILERTRPGLPRRFLGGQEVLPDQCSEGCCQKSREPGTGNREPGTVNREP